MTITAHVYYQPAYFNKNCFCTIPPCFKAEVVDDLSDRFPSYVHCDPIGIGSTEKEAVTTLIDALKAAGIHGKLRIER